YSRRARDVSAFPLRQADARAGGVRLAGGELVRAGGVWANFDALIQLVERALQIFRGVVGDAVVQLVILDTSLPQARESGGRESAGDAGRSGDEAGQYRRGRQDHRDLAISTSGVSTHRKAPAFTRNRLTWCARRSSLSLSTERSISTPHA